MYIMHFTAKNYNAALPFPLERLCRGGRDTVEGGAAPPDGGAMPGHGAGAATGGAAGPGDRRRTETGTELLTGTGGDGD